MADGFSVDPLHTVNSSVYVLYDDSNYYEGKVQKRELYDKATEDGTTQKVWRYFVHYMGWNKKFDEWVDEPLCLTHNPNAGLSALAGPTSKKGKGHGGAGAKGNKPQMALAIPPLLKQHLVDEQAAVKGGRVLPLPRPATIESILERHLQQQRHLKGEYTGIDADEQAAFGLRHFFDNSVRQGWSILLYNEERAAADEQLNQGKAASKIFGAEHLLRLFVKLPVLLAVDSSTQEQYRLLQQKLHDVLDFMCDNYEAFFAPMADYVPASGQAVASQPHAMEVA